MTKNELRKKYKMLRQELSEDSIDQKSMAIANRLLQLDIWDFHFYHVFLSIVSQKEVDTHFILHILLGKDKNIVVSKSNFNDFSMKHFLLTESLKLKPNAYHIPEPIEDANAIEISESKIDVVFVPLLAFDINGYRVGYGKGFYDIFLSKCKPDTIKIGLSFFDVLETIDDIHNQDFKLDFVVTPSEIHRF